MREKFLRPFFHRFIRRFFNREIWLGEKRLIDPYEWIRRFLLRLMGSDQAVLLLNHADTMRILSTFPQVDITASEDVLNKDSFLSDSQRDETVGIFKEYIADVQTTVPESDACTPEFTVAIPFYAHIKYLKTCLRSVEKAFEHIPDTPAEVLIVNDDPRFTANELVESVPFNLQKYTRVVCNPENSGICTTLNNAVELANYKWIVHLDCDDMLTPDCLKVLKKWIEKYPSVRYVSTRMLDIDHQGSLLRCRLRFEKPSDLIDRGMIAGHLKVIRKDLFQDIGPYLKQYEGCQDYEFALRVSLFEPLMFLPDYLYQYRWHGNTQSVSQAKRQNETARKIIDTYLVIGMILNKTAIFPVSVVFEGKYSANWHQWVEKYIPKNIDGRKIIIHSDKAFSEQNIKIFVIHLACYLVENPIETSNTDRLTF